jgi:hypothetical protein
MKNKFNIIYGFLILLSTFQTLNGQTRVLEVPFITQQPHGQWCWAASTAMISTYYGNNSSMCGIVEWARLNITSPNRGGLNCCGQPTPTPCENYLFTWDIPSILGSQGLACISSGVVSLANLQSYINDNRPLLILGTKSTSANFHSLVIIGYNNSDLYYIDPIDGYYITSYTNATTMECLGAFNSKWRFYTYRITTNHCPPYLFLHNTIGSNASIHAQVSLTIDGKINNNSNVTLLSGSIITLNPGFEIQVGSSLNVNVTSSPCL